jgi:hypothetical protein
MTHRAVVFNLGLYTKLLTDTSVENACSFAMESRK